MIIANTDLLYLTIDNMMIETSGESPESEPVRQNQLLIDRETGQTLHVHMWAHFILTWNLTPGAEHSTMLVLLLLVFAVTRPVTSRAGGVRVYDIGQTGLVTCPGRNDTGLNLDKLRSVTFYKASTKNIFSWVLKMFILEATQYISMFDILLSV